MEGGEGAGREHGRAPRCRPPAAFAAHCVAVAAETGAAAGGLGGGPGQARGTAAPEGRVCQQRAHGPSPSLPGARPGPAGASRDAPRGKPPAHAWPWTGRGTLPFIAPPPRDAPRCQPGRWGWSVSMPRQCLMLALPGSLFLSQIYGGRFAAGGDLSSSVRGNECCHLNALPSTAPVLHVFKE